MFTTVSRTLNRMRHDDIGYSSFMLDVVINTGHVTRARRWQPALVDGMSTGLLCTVRKFSAIPFGQVCISEVWHECAARSCL